MLSTVIFAKALLIVLSWCVTYHMYETEKQYNESFSLMDKAYEEACNQRCQKIDKEWI